MERKLGSLTREQAHRLSHRLAYDFAAVRQPALDPNGDPSIRTSEALMAQLPSGRQIGITAAPLEDVLLDTAPPNGIGRIMGLKCVADLHPHITILEVRTLGPAESVEAPELAAGSEPMPPNAELADTGYRLSDWHMLAAHWSQADRAAMEVFIRERVNAYLESLMPAVADAQHRLLASENLFESMAAALYRAGLHWDQD